MPTNKYAHEWTDFVIGIGKSHAKYGFYEFEARNVNGGGDSNIVRAKTNLPTFELLI